MLAFSRHFKDALITPVCSIWEIDGAVGGNSMLWRTVNECTTRGSSLVVLPQLLSLENHQTTNYGIVVDPEVKITVVCLNTDDDVLSAIKRAVDVDRREYPSRHRIVIFESATTLSLLHSFETLVTALLQCSMSPHVQGVVALFQADCFSQREVAQLRKLCSCSFLLKPAASLNSDWALATTGHCMHVHAVFSLLRYSGMTVNHGISELAATLQCIQFIIVLTFPWEHPFAGRVRVEQSRYAMMASGHLQYFVSKHLEGKVLGACYTNH